MIFPKYIKKNDIIAVTAPSNGITDEIKIKRFNKGVEQLKNRGFSIVKAVFRFNTGTDDVTLVKL